MAHSFKMINRFQDYLMPPSLTDWLPEDHLVWAVLEAMNQFDVSSFVGSYKDGGKGGVAYPPSVMAALILYAACIGDLSARRIERKCRSDIGYRVICANEIPDHSTIARFLIRHRKPLEELFCQMLHLCAKSGLIKGTVLAVDGSKIQGNATKDARVSVTKLAKKLLDEAVVQNAEEDLELGDARGDEVPKVLRDKDWIRATLEEFLATTPTPEPQNSEAASDWCKTKDPRAESETTPAEPQDEQGPEVVIKTEVLGEVAEVVRDKAFIKARLQEFETLTKSQRGLKADTDPAPDAPKSDETRPEKKKKRPPSINATDPDVRLVRTRNGMREGYNAQAVASEDQIIVGADLTQKVNDVALFIPMAKIAAENLAQAKLVTMPEILVGDGGYWSSDVMLEETGFVHYTNMQRHSLKNKNFEETDPEFLETVMEMYLAGEISRSQAAFLLEIGANNVSDFRKNYTVNKDAALASYGMRKRNRGEEAKEIYKKRQCLIEPVFGQMKQTQNASRFMRRGLKKCKTEWLIHCTAHNLKKWARHRRAKAKAANEVVAHDLEPNEDS